jgi:hypothetical protein
MAVTAEDIKSLYQHYLGREPLQSGIDGWLAAAASGQSLVQIATGISQSPEAAVYRTYQQTLGREPEMEERQAWVEEINTTGSVQQAVDAIATSPEANAYQAEEELDILDDTTADDTTADSGDESNQQFNEEGERLYYWVPSGEGLDVAGIQSETEESRLGTLLADDGGYYTEQEIYDAFHADEGMTTLSSQVSWEQYWGYLTERQDLIDAGVLRTGLDATSDGRQAGIELVQGAGGLMAAGGAKAASAGTGATKKEVYQDSYFAIISDPIQVALMEKYGIPASHQTDDGSVYEWNGSSFTKTYQPEGLDFGKVVLGTVLALTVGPAAGAQLAGAAGLSSAVATGAISGAVGSALSQTVITGSIDPKQLLTAGAIGGITSLATDMANAQAAADAQAQLAADSFADSFSMLSAGEAAALTEIVEKHGHLIDIYGVTASTVDSAFALGATGAGGIGSVVQTNISNLANTLGISYDATLNIVEGVAVGAIAGDDVEGIVLNALGNVSEAHIMQGLENTFGDSIDVKNWFKDGYTDIPVDALQPLVSGAIEAAVDGGMSLEDALTTAADYFGEGGNLDFLLPPGAEFSIVFPNLCPEGSTNPLCNLKIPDGGGFDLKCPSFLKSADGTCLPINIDVGGGLTCPEGFRDENGTCVPININCPEGFENKDGECVPITVGCPEGFEDKDGTCVPININCPEGFKYSESQKQCIEIVCPQGFKNEAGECVPIECPAGFRYDDSRGECIQIPKINCEDLNFAIPNSKKGQTHSKKVNEDGTEECVPDVVECIEGFDFDGQSCVEIPDLPKCPDTQVPNGVQKNKRDSLGNCVPDVIECIEGFDFDGQKCVKVTIDVGCEDKQIPNGVQKYKKNSLGECVPDVIECIEGFELQGQTCVKIEITTPCLGGKVRNETTGECECPPDKEENALGICVDPVDKCPEGQQRNAEGVCEDIDDETPDVDTPDIDVAPPKMPDINVPQFQPIQFQQPTQVTADPQLLTRSQFPITDYLSQAIKGGGMLTGNGNKLV